MKGWNNMNETLRLQSYIAHHDGDEYRQCPECGSLDFTFNFYKITLVEKPNFNYDGMNCKCDKCGNKWKVKIE